ncbi:hypothetical protein [Ferruginibacter sp. SUN106]|uniref:hypothetical protein n=1 Tax=Ferruginibacter sp. SUN106 TaxID=2978348 RepID=UPI003D35E4B0
MKTYLAIGTLVLITLLSCKKELSIENSNSGTGGSGGSGTATDSFFLSKIVEIDSLSKDSSVTYFDYDNLKRVTTVRNLEQGFPIDTSYSFYYSGNAVLPYKTIYHYFSSETFHNYNSQNKLIRDSISGIKDTGHIIYNTRSYSTLDYTYNSDKIIINKVTHSFDAISNTMQVFTSLDTTKIDANGNLIFTRLNYVHETAAFTYNDKLNPVAKLNIFPSLPPYGYYENDEIFVPSPNLWITSYQTSQQFGGSTLTVDDKQFNITYNTKNYPVKSVVSVNNGALNPLTYYYPMYFYYKVL